MPAPGTTPPTGAAGGDRTRSPGPPARLPRQALREHPPSSRRGPPPPRPSSSPSPPGLPAVLTVLGLLSVTLVAVGVLLPALAPSGAAPHPPPAAAPPPPSAGSPPTTAPPATAPPARASITVVSRPSGQVGAWSALEASSVRGDLVVELRGELLAVRAVRYVLHAPDGQASQAASRAAPYGALLPMRTAPPGPWRLEVVADSPPGPVLASAGFRVAGG